MPETGHIVPGKHGNDSGRCSCGMAFKRLKSAGRIRAADHLHVEAALRSEVVDKASGPGDQSLVLHPPEGASDPGLGREIRRPEEIEG
jgi:hypothetical protein